MFASVPNENAELKLRLALHYTIVIVIEKKNRQ